MARIARVVVPGVPHHVTQRGNRRQKVFFSKQDYSDYLTLVQHYCKLHKTEVWGYCLMPNHVHLAMIPISEDGLRKTLAEAHRRYTRMIHFRYNWRGYLWQGRFASFPMDENHLLAAIKYIELNPVRAGLCTNASDWPWSSANAHINGIDDQLVKVSPMLERVNNWNEYLGSPTDPENATLIRKHSKTGRPLGSDQFLSTLENITGRVLRLKRAGRKPKNQVP